MEQATLNISDFVLLCFYLPASTFVIIHS